MQIRVMTIDDYDELVRLWKGTPGMGLNAVDDSREGIAQYLRRNPTTSFVALQDGQIVGSIMAGHDGRRGMIYHTAVLQAYRRQGIAAKLVDAAMDALESEGIQKAALVVFGSNTLGNAFWERIGFTVRNDLIYRNKYTHK